MGKKAVCIISGGLDSALASYIAKDSGYEIIALHFNYGQKTEKKELQAFNLLAQNLQAQRAYSIELDFFKLIGASSLTDSSLTVPTGGLEDGVPNTYVPFRNGIFLSIATAIAEKEKAQAIYIGVVAQDSSGYPDCTQDFIKKHEQAINAGTKDETKLTIQTPLIALQKSEIVSQAVSLAVPIELTWSCYKNEDKACGVCDSCRLRLRGFEQIGMVDPIAYKDDCNL